MSDAGAIYFTDLSTMIITLFVGVTVLAFIYISKISNSSQDEKEVSNKTNEILRKKKSSSGNVPKPNKKKHNDKWSQDSNKQNFSHTWLLTSLKGHSGRVLDMDFSSNGKFLATCAEDTTEEPDPGGGGSSENSSGSEANKENSPQTTRTNHRGGLTRRQKRNRVRREDDAAQRNPASKKAVGKPVKNRQNVVVSDLVPALRQYIRLNLVDSDLTVLLRHYLLSPDQLMSLGFPVESALYPGRAIIYKNSTPTKQYALTSSSHFFDVNAREFVPMSKQSYVHDEAFFSSLVQREHQHIDYRDIGLEWNTEHSQQTELLKNNLTELCDVSDRSDRSQDVSESSDCCEVIETKNITEEKHWSSSDEKKCVRCRRGFFVTLDGEYLTQEKCLYHWGKLEKLEFTCCKGGSETRGCTVGKLHVWNGVGTGVNGPYEGYVRTRPRKTPPEDGDYGIYALDCEMCFTTRGLELTKVTVVRSDGRLVYDHLVRPENYIIDYNTRFSGITARDLRKSTATKSLKDVQTDLLSFIDTDTILIGHGLENDLRALRIIHNTVIDTSVVFPHFYGLPYRRSLKSLVGCFLKRKIQQDSSGHDSFEDARACIELMLWRIRKDFHSILA